MTINFLLKLFDLMTAAQRSGITGIVWQNTLFIDNFTSRLNFSLKFVYQNIIKFLRHKIILLFILS